MRNESNSQYFLLVLMTSFFNFQNGKDWA